MNSLIFPVVSILGAVVVIARLISLGAFSSDGTVVINLVGQGRGQTPRPISEESRSVNDHIDVNRNTLMIDWPTQHLIVQTVTPLAIVMISTRPESKPKRVAIRKTWGRWCEDNPHVKFVFFMGIPEQGDLRSLFIESTEYDDIVLDNFDQKSKFSSSLKTLHMFKWFEDFYGNSIARPKFIIKAEDDVFLHIPNILSYLNSSEVISSKKFLGGSLHTFEKVTRDPQSKYYVPRVLLRKPKFPSHLGRSFYVLSSVLAQEIFQASFQVPLFHLEDVYITGMIGNEALGINLHNLASNDVIVERTLDLRRVLKYKTNIWRAMAYHGADYYLLKYLYESADMHVTQS